LACGGMAGRAPRFQIQMWSRRARLLSPRSATPHSGASGKRASSGAARGSSCAGPGGQNEGDGPSRAVGDHASLGPVAAMRTAERLTSTPLRRSGAVLVAPAAFRWAWIEVPSRAGGMPPAHAELDAARLGHGEQPLPLAEARPPDERLRGSGAVPPTHHGPNASGMARHFAPFACRQRIAETVRRRCRGGTFAGGRHASNSGSSTAHCSSVSTSTAQEFRRLTGPRRGAADRIARVE